MYLVCNTTLWSLSVRFTLREHDGAIFITTGQLLRLLFVKIWGNRKIYLLLNIVGS